MPVGVGIGHQIDNAAFDGVCECRHGSEAHLCDAVTVAHSPLRPVVRKQDILRRQPSQREKCQQLIPCPVLLSERALPRQELRKQLMGAGFASRKVTWRVGEQLLDEQIVRHRVTEEDGHVDGVVVERPCVWLVVHEGRTGNVEHFERQPECIRQGRICTEMCDPVREANQRVVPSRCGVDALGISGRQPVKNFHLGTHKPIPFRMGEPYRASHALARNRVDHVLFDAGDHCLEIFLEMCTRHVELRCISNELR